MTADEICKIAVNLQDEKAIKKGWSWPAQLHKCICLKMERKWCWRYLRRCYTTITSVTSKTPMRVEGLTKTDRVYLLDVVWPVYNGTHPNKGNRWTQDLFGAKDIDNFCALEKRSETFRSELSCVLFCRSLPVRWCIPRSFAAQLKMDSNREEEEVEVSAKEVFAALWVPIFIRRHLAVINKIHKAQKWPIRALYKTVHF